MIARRTLKRIRRILSGAFYCALIGGVAYLAITRWNGTPADPRGGVGRPHLPPQPIDPALDRTDEYIAALAAIPPKPIVTLPPPPAGMKWSPANWGGNPIELSDVTAGDWTPETRPNLQAVVDYLNTPATEDAMRKLAAIRPGGCRRSEVSPSSVRNAVKMFTARARYRHASQDIEGAIADLKTVCRLATIGYHAGESLHVLSGTGCEGEAYEDLRCMAHEHALTREQMETVCRMIRSETPEPNELLELMEEAVFGVMQQSIDITYTNDGSGNGWLVLSRLDDIVSMEPARAPRSGLWNALSVLYNDRRTVTNKIERTRKALDRAADASSYTEAMIAVEAADQSCRHFNLLDGPLAYTGSQNSAVWFFKTNVQREAGRGATLIAAALSAYRTDHGRYPSTQDVLLDGYLDSLPLDPYTGELLRYVPTDDGKDYKLYTVGPNQTDDGGERAWGATRDESPNAPDDQVFTHTRGTTYNEPRLEPITQ